MTCDLTPTEPAIETLIGWEERWIEGTPFGGMTWFDQHGETHDRGAQVDDLLTYLHVNAPAHWDYGGTSTFWAEVSWPSPVKTPFVIRRSPTLIEALTAAVRAVAALTPTEPPRKDQT